ncbi:hypothetical protein H5410_048528 [Solanum commersonii]|uniref:Uncharacterized protein n=1 Tax=Solanum commersonii TaxID=4109 RepID=A0A9J5XLZ8_SOLCO|nr:hypothetical protein H5410_048528 [Solanum commersonii]
MNQATILKKKGSNPNKAQSPLKNLDADMQYRLSVKLVNTFKIKREHVANECNNKSNKEHAPIAHKRKNFEDFIQPQGKSSLFGFQTLFKEGVTASVHVTGTTLGNEEEQHDIQDLLSFIQVKRKLKEHDIDHDLPNIKQVNHIVADVECMPALSIHEHNKGLDDLEDQEEIGEDECAIDEEVDIDWSTKGLSKLKKVRGQTTCKNIHARNLEEMEKVTFDKGQVVGPTAKRLDDIPEVQFRQLIEYRKHPTVQRVAKENKEEPSQSEMFIATLTKTGKEIQADTKVAIKLLDFLVLDRYHRNSLLGRKAELQNCQNSGETTDDAFRAVFGKESVATSSLKEDEETNKLKQKHANEISFLKEEINEMREEMRHFFSQLLQNNPGLNVQDIQGVVGSNLVSPVDASSTQAVRGQNIPYSSRSTHDPVLEKLWLICVCSYGSSFPARILCVQVIESVYRKRRDKDRQSCVILEVYVQSRSASGDWIFEANEHAQLKDKT